MWRSPRTRLASAKRRLALAASLWRWRPHPKQKQFFTSPAQVRVAACGRRWGKTESLSVDVATLAVAEALDGRDCRQLVVAPTDTQARLIGGETLSLLLDAFERESQGLCPELAGYVIDVRQRPSLQITLCKRGVDARASNDKKARGDGPAVSRIIFRTSGRDGRGLRGLWAHRIVVDEAGYVPDQVIDEVLMPMLADVGGDLIMASSPAGRRSAYFRCFARGEAAPNAPDTHGVTYQAFQCPSTDNPHIDQAWLAALRDDMGESRYAQEVLAHFVDDFGAVFRADDIDGCLASDDTVSLVEGNLVSSPVEGRWYSVGVDWGRKLDFTVVAVLDGTDRAEGRPARLVGLWRMQGAGWEAQVARVGEIVAAFRPLRALCDGNSIGDPLAETLQQAIRGRITDGDYCPVVERFLFAGESKVRLVDHLTLGLSARSLTYPSHRALLSELRGFEYGGETAAGRHRMAAKGGGHDDIVMALALAWYCAPEGSPPPPSSLLLLGSSVGQPLRDEIR